MSHERKGSGGLPARGLALALAIGVGVPWIAGSSGYPASEDPSSMTPDVPVEFQTMRPIRSRQKILLTVGPGEADLRGQDDKAIQAAVDYVYRLGGGTVQLLPGTFTLRNAVYLRPGITLRGAGAETVLRKAPSVSTPLVREADWYEYAVQVADATGFTVGCGLALSTTKEEWPALRLYTVTAIRGNVLYLDQRTEKDYFLADSARAQTIFSLLHGLSVADVTVEDLVLDGNAAQNDPLDGNYGGAVFMQYCDRWTFRNVTAQNYNGDAFSFQVCDDIHFENCQALHNTGLGFHPGSGSQRPVFRQCLSRGNRIGLFWCWGVCDGVAEDCVFSENRQQGVNFGHRDTDNILRRCTIERNGEGGVLFRQEPNEYRTPDRNCIEDCLIRDNQGTGIDIQWKTKDLVIRRCRFQNTADGAQKVAIRISPEAERIVLEGNLFQNCPVEVEDQRSPS